MTTIGRHNYIMGFDKMGMVGLYCVLNVEMPVQILPFAFKYYPYAAQGAILGGLFLLYKNRKSIATVGSLSLAKRGNDSPRVEMLFKINLS